MKFPGNRHFWIPVGCAALCVLATAPWWVVHAAGEGGFDGVVDSIESHYHQHAMRIPLMGLASVVAGVATHGGVGGVHVAEFEQFSAPVDGDDLNRLVEEKLGQGWNRMIRETSRHGGEQTFIFSRPEGKHMCLFILDLEGKELNVVQVSVDPDRLNETIVKYKHNNGDDHSAN
ncbi:MAG TPA: hypothetical protein VMT38_09860 [Terracidiphilus sp.]|nr:hypothetical protein [Terracidiphilus sp.]